MATELAELDRLYPSLLSPRDHTGLADLLVADSLDGEIAMLRVLIRRQLTGPPIEQTTDGRVTHSVDILKISRYIHPLCHAIKARRSTPVKTQREIERPLLRLLERGDDSEYMREPAAMHPPIRPGESLMDKYTARAREAGFTDLEQAALARIRFSEP